jgi:hypothetical protein
MAKLSEEDQAAFDKLKARMEEPDEPASNSSQITNLHIDLSDEDAVKRAQGLGLLGQFKDLLNGDDDDTDDTDDTEDKKAKGKTDRAPKRQGFFGNEE